MKKMYVKNEVKGDAIKMQERKANLIESCLNESKDGKRDTCTKCKHVAVEYHEEEGDEVVGFCENCGERYYF